MKSNMNRNDRRAQRAAAKHAAVPRVVAFHEAGHAVGRYLTAGLMGFSEDYAIYSIVLEAVTPDMPRYTSGDGKYELSTAAVTYGATFSAEINAISNDIDAEMEPGDIGSADYRKRVVAEARNRGADIESWLQARCVIAVSGPLAEAVARGLSFDEVWDSPECRNDLEGLILDCMCAGVEQAQDIDKRIDGARDFMLEKMRQPEFCNALNAVAARLRKPEKVLGATVTKIIRQAIDGGTVNSGPRAVT